MRRPNSYIIVLALLAGSLMVCGWSICKRTIAGSGYRWVTWDEIYSQNWYSETSSPPLTKSAQKLDGARVVILAQKMESFPANNNDDAAVCTLRVPETANHLFDQPSISALGIDPSAWWKTDGWGVVRVWGQLRLKHSAPRPEDLSAFEMQIDRVDDEPSFLVDALVPTSLAGWTAWALTPAILTISLFPAARIIRRILRVQRAGIIAAACSALLGLIFLVGPFIARHWMTWDIHFRDTFTYVTAGRDGLRIWWSNDYAISPRPSVKFEVIPQDRYGGYSARVFAGIGLSSVYTRADWGSVHDNIQIFIAPGWFVTGFALLAVYAWCCSRPRLAQSRDEPARLPGFWRRYTPTAWRPAAPA